MVYICSSSWLLADKSRDLSQAVKKITVAKVEQIKEWQVFLLKMTTFDHFELKELSFSKFA